MDLLQHPVVYVMEILVAICYPAPNDNCHRCKALAASSHSTEHQCLQLHKH